MFVNVDQLAAVAEDLKAAGVSLRVIGIGDAGSAERYARFTGLPLELVRVDPDATVHRALGLHSGPGWEVPAQIPEKFQAVAKAWLNYMAMCAGIGAPGTLQEILRGYLGDRYIWRGGVAEYVGVTRTYVNYVCIHLCDADVHVCAHGFKLYFIFGMCML
jgi:hypothetical protein